MWVWMLIGILKIQLSFFTSRLKFNIAANWEISSLYYSHSYYFFRNKLFMNVHCDSPYIKVAYMNFWKFKFKCFQKRVKFKNVANGEISKCYATPPLHVVIILFQPNFLWMFAVTCLTKVTYLAFWDFKLFERSIFLLTLDLGWESNFHKRYPSCTLRFFSQHFFLNPLFCACLKLPTEIFETSNLFVFEKKKIEN